MKIYRVSALGKPTDRRFAEYADLAAEDDLAQSINPDLEEFMGTPYGLEWKTPTLYIAEPLLPKPNFFWTNLGVGLFACDEVARELAGGPMEMSGELLPIHVEGEKGEYWIFNVTKCLNVVDEEKSEWQFLPGNHRLLMRPAFLPQRLGDECLFKIPQDRGASIYCLERTVDGMCPSRFCKMGWGRWSGKGSCFGVPR